MGEKNCHFKKYFGEKAIKKNVYQGQHNPKWMVRNPMSNKFKFFKAKSYALSLMFHHIFPILIYT